MRPVKQLIGIAQIHDITLRTNYHFPRVSPEFPAGPAAAYRLNAAEWQVDIGMQARLSGCL